MSYKTSKGIHVDALPLALTPTAAFAAAATTNGAAVELGRNRIVTLTLTTSAVSASDTLDVTIQSSQNGTNWFTAGTFTQHTAPASETKTFICGRFMRPVYVAAGSGVSITVSALTGEAV
jgi:hypothetical protein